jgi:chromate transport protein ChrA
MTAIELATRIFVVLHLIGLASLLGGFLTQMKDLKNGGRIVPAMMHGAWTLLVTGFALVGLVGMSGSEHVDNILLAAKSVIIGVIFFLCYGYSKKELSTKKWVVPTIGLLTVVNICIAVIGGIVQSGAATGA